MRSNRNNDRQHEFNEEEYKGFETKLFSDATPPLELKNICITLAHLPTRNAQDLLNRFMKSNRANEVESLDLASEDTNLTPLDTVFLGEKKNKRDRLIQGVVQDIQVEIVVLRRRLEECKRDLAKKEIECEAIRELVQKGEVEVGAELELLDRLTSIETAVEGFRKQIMLKEKIINQIKSHS